MIGRVILGICCAAGLMVIFLTQQWSAADFFGLPFEGIGAFIFNRSIRFILNDLLAIGLIHALFNNRRFTLLAFYVQIFGMVFILFPYFIAKLYYPSYNGPLINFIHRIILNPLLILLLIPAFYYQKKIAAR